MHTPARDVGKATGTYVGKGTCTYVGKGTGTFKALLPPFAMYTDPLHKQGSTGTGTFAFSCSFRAGKLAFLCFTKKYVFGSQIAFSGLKIIFWGPKSCFEAPQAVVQPRGGGVGASKRLRPVMLLYICFNLFIYLFIYLYLFCIFYYILAAAKNVLSPVQYFHLFLRLLLNLDLSNL